MFKKKFISVSKFFFFSFLFLFFIVFSGILFLFLFYARDLPRPEKFTEHQIFQSTKIYDRTGEILLYELYNEEKRTVMPLNAIPDHLIKAVLATEDVNFYKHRGLDFRAIFRAVLVDLKLGGKVQGGSTISQQLIRSSFLTREKTAARKTKEIFLALELERRYSKDKILEWYLNQIPFGSNAYGVEAASRTIFNKSVKEISLNESAVLAALIRAPSYLSPFGENKEKLIARKNSILKKMTNAGFITKEQERNAQNEEVKFSSASQKILAPHFVFYVIDYLIEKYGEDALKEKGFKVYTTLDLEFQKFAEETIKEKSKINENYNAHNASLIALDPKKGEILAMVGSKDWFAEPYPANCQPGVNCLFDPKVNVAVYKNGRQPGSAFKPFVYAVAFKKGYNDETIVVDEETNFGIFGGKPYIPHNYDNRFRGPVTLRSALAQSLNIPAVKVLAYMAGLEDSIQFAKEMGITTLTKEPSFYGLSIVLGGGETKLLDMVSAYSVFANNGLKVPSKSILRIEDSKGKIIEESKKNSRRILESRVCGLITDILSDNEARAPMFGNRSYLYFENYPVAVKTGTTTNFRDAWTIGYTPSIVVGVWVGNSNNAPMKGVSGVIGAGNLWHSFMEKILPKIHGVSETKNFNSNSLFENEIE